MLWMMCLKPARAATSWQSLGPAFSHLGGPRDVGICVGERITLEIAMVITLGYYYSLLWWSMMIRYGKMSGKVEVEKPTIQRDRNRDRNRSKKTQKHASCPMLAVLNLPVPWMPRMPRAKMSRRCRNRAATPSPLEGATRYRRCSDGMSRDKNACPLDWSWNAICQT